MESQQDESIMSKLNAMHKDIQDIQLNVAAVQRALADVKARPLRSPSWTPMPISPPTSPSAQRKLPEHDFVVTTILDEAGHPVTITVIGQTYRVKDALKDLATANGVSWRWDGGHYTWEFSYRLVFSQALEKFLHERSNDVVLCTVDHLHHIVDDGNEAKTA